MPTGLLPFSLFQRRAAELRFDNEFNIIPHPEVGSFWRQSVGHAEIGPSQRTCCGKSDPSLWVVDFQARITAVETHVELNRPRFSPECQVACHDGSLIAG